jgi:pimeloyl-ACP methyl ester carboxylesterase
VYDLPATLDYISEVTGFEKIAYIGHSMGTTEMFYGLAALPDYFNMRLSIFVALAPVGTVFNTLVVPFQFVGRYYDFAETIIDLFKIGPVFSFH